MILGQVGLGTSTYNTALPRFDNAHRHFGRPKNLSRRAIGACYERAKGVSFVHHGCTPILYRARLVRALPTGAPMWITRIVSSAVFLLLVLTSIPLAFDVGGRTCGLAFSLSLSGYYFLYSALRLITPDGSRFRRSLVILIAYTQWFMIPTLMIWSLNKFSVDADSSSGWVERTFGHNRAGDASIKEWLLGKGGLLETVWIGGWDKSLRYSTPIFQIGEGFCSLLVIQAAGQITRWLVNRERGDSWMVCLNFPFALL